LNILKIRIASILFIITAILYFSWLIRTLNTNALWLSPPFFAANLYTSSLICITIFNNWNRSAPKLIKLPEGLEPGVAVLIPTYGEPVDMLKITIESVLHQQWPNEKLVVVIGDDGRRPEVRSMVESLQRYYASARLIYHLPPPKNTPQRIGNAKDGNLNSMLRFISINYPV
jgi:cellulose synthase (UDP-forming)